MTNILYLKQIPWFKNTKIHNRTSICNTQKYKSQLDLCYKGLLLQPPPSTSFLSNLTLRKKSIKWRPKAAIFFLMPNVEIPFSSTIPYPKANKLDGFEIQTHPPPSLTQVILRISLFCYRSPEEYLLSYWRCFCNGGGFRHLHCIYFIYTGLWVISQNKQPTRHQVSSRAILRCHSFLSTSKWMPP